MERVKPVAPGNSEIADNFVPATDYHSTSHEVLCVVGGSASIALGGPQSEIIEVSAGDAVVIPAGVAYTRGQENYDLRTGEVGERPEVLENISNTGLPESDPLIGKEGPLVRRWKG